MKAKVIIENGKTEIVLTPENQYETSMLEDTYDSRLKKSIPADVFLEDNKIGAKVYTLKLYISDRKSVEMKG